jgi:hypothetical protein
MIQINRNIDISCGVKIGSIFFLNISCNKVWLLRNKHGIFASPYERKATIRRRLTEEIRGKNDH